MTTSVPPDGFVTRHGERIALDPGHHKASLMHAGGGYTRAWDANSDDETVLAYLRDAAQRVRLGVHLLAVHGVRLDGARVLVIGAGDGAEAAILAGLGATSVVGSDYGDAFVDDAAFVARRERLLDVARTHAATLGLRAGATPTFGLDDITRSRFADASFDVVVSWQTLEHLADAGAALREMRRVLSPGGVAYHEYNPYFALDGGHRLCTLPTPWGHVRLDGDDVERLLRACRPDEADAAIAFFHGGLNRMTQGDLLAAAAAAGLETLSFVPRSRTEDLLLLTPEAWAQAERTHPNVTVNDLVCRVVRIVLRRP